MFRCSLTKYGFNRLSIGESSKGERGTALLETAICLPFIILLTLGIIEYGLGMRHRQVILDAARSGARSAATLPSNPNLPNSCTHLCSCLTQYPQAVAHNYLQNAGLDSLTFKVKATKCLLPPEGGISTQVIRVQVSRCGSYFGHVKHFLPAIPTEQYEISTFGIENAPTLSSCALPSQCSTSVEKLC